MMKGGREGVKARRISLRDPSPSACPRRRLRPHPGPPALSSSLFFFSPLLSPCCLPSSHFLISHIMRSFPRSGMYHSYNATGTAMPRDNMNMPIADMASTSSLTFTYTLDLLTGHTYINKYFAGLYFQFCGVQ